MIKPYYETKLGKLYHGHNLIIMPYLPKVDLLLTDPPFGIGNYIQLGGNVSGRGKYKGVAVPWNDSVPTNKFFNLVRMKSKHRIIWGANFFNCFEGDGGAIVWLKKQNMPNFSKVEIASCTHLKKTELIHGIHWTGSEASRDAETDHPSERPPELYAWCINYVPKVETVMDPFLGSGSVAIACERLNKRWYGIELSEEYCEDIAKRVEKEVNKPKLFQDQMG